MNTPRTVGEAYDSVASFYDKHFASIDTQADNRALFQFLANVGYSKGDMVDLGCGTGLVLEHYLKYPWSYVGIDVSPGMLEKACSKFPEHRFLEADMVATGLPSESADVVLSTFGGFSYVAQPLDAVREIERILKPGGLFAVMAYGLPARNCPDIVEETGDELFNMFYEPLTLKALFETLFADVTVRGFCAQERADLEPLTTNQATAYVLDEIDRLGEDDSLECTYVIAMGSKNA